MPNQITKRDGSIVPFDSNKIYAAVYKASNVVKDVESMTANEIMFITEQVVKMLNGVDTCSIEDVQDFVEKALVKFDFPNTAKEYIIYRNEHNKIRNNSSYLMDIYKKLTYNASSDEDIKRENANIDGDTAMGTMLKYGSEGSKFFIDNYILPKDISAAHANGDIHIHDKDFYMLTETCCQIDLIKLFKDGFSTGHGYLREPNAIESYSALACIAIQADQNEMHGGQSVPHFDYCMAPGVVKTYRQEFKRAFITHMTISNKTESEDIEAIYSNILDSTVMDKLIGIDDTSRFIDTDIVPIFSVVEVQNKCGITDSTSVNDACAYARKEALKRTTRRTYQAMEALVHNLNTMSCLPPNEEFWVYDKMVRKLLTYTAEQFYKIYKPGRYMALSVNNTTGVMELKDILGVKEGKADHPIVRVTDITGSDAHTTSNHRYMSISDDGSIDYNVPEELSFTTLPRNFVIPTTEVYDSIDMSKYSIFEPRKDSPCKLDTVQYSAALAELLGYYVGDGHVQQDDTTIGYNFDIKVDPQHILDLFKEAFSFVPSYRLRKRARVNDPDTIVTATMFVNCGVRVGRLFRELAGSYANAKHVPDFVMHGSKELQNAFLKGYLICDGCRTKTYIEFSTVSKPLAYDLRLLFLSRGELMTVTCRHREPSGFAKTSLPLYTGIIGYNAAERLGIDNVCNCGIKHNAAFEIPKYNTAPIVNIIKNDGVKWGELPAIPRRVHASPAVRYHELDAIDMSDAARQSIEPLTKLYRVPVKNKVVYDTTANPTMVYDIAVADNENFMLLSGIIVHNSRAGAQVPFSSLNYGTDTSTEGRMVVKQLLLATEAGLGNGETSIFPVQIFKLKAGVNYNPEDPNYDLFKLAMETSSKRLFPKQNWGLQVAA